MLDVAKTIGTTLGLDVSTTHDTAPPAFDFVITAWVAVLLLAARLGAERIFIPAIAYALGAPKNAKAQKKAEAVFDDAFIGFFSALLEIFAIYNTVFHNFGCTPWSTDACLLGWPEHHLNILQRLYFIFMFHYYLYELLSTALGVGTVLKRDMVYHHFATMALISLAYHVNVVRMGTMWQALFDLSNPVLHIAKVVHALQLPVLKDMMLPTFALVFFVVRIVVPPFAIMWPGFMLTPGVLGLTWAAVFIALMVFICLLQFFWFYKIIKLATSGSSKSKED